MLAAIAYACLTCMSLFVTVLEEHASGGPQVVCSGDVECNGVYNEETCLEHLQ